MLGCGYILCLCLEMCCDIFRHGCYYVFEHIALALNVTLSFFHMLVVALASSVAIVTRMDLLNPIYVSVDKLYSSHATGNVNYFFHI